MTWQPVAKLKRMDENRPNIPGEHWLTLGGGVALWLSTRRHPSLTVRLLAGIAGGLLVARAVSGSHIPSSVKRAIPYAGSRSS